ncbi:MAG: 16S rRNA (guanine(966)-N(2))-methyltransferase RsmD [Candidatus Omnitrophica bacterium]|nr:16S rRNA (guanine(966)-N(2))-methyltransferase RsmD [Candidatus Omnitrophota bacterium]
MKVINGQLKGRNFYMPSGIRPTSNLVRKAVFDVIGQDMEGCSVLELFAGSGAMGIEAISLGAKQVFIVENDAKCVSVIRDNMLKLGVDIRLYEISARDAFASIKLFDQEGKKFDIIFADPPFSRDLAKKTLKRLGGYDILHPNSLLVIQHEKREILPEKEASLTLIRRKNYGLNTISIYRRCI